MTISHFLSSHIFFDSLHSSKVISVSPEVLFGRFLQIIVSVISWHSLSKSLGLNDMDGEREGNRLSLGRLDGNWLGLDDMDGEREGNRLSLGGLDGNWLDDRLSLGLDDIDGEREGNGLV